jgi:hypothetical protein
MTQTRIVVNAKLKPLAQELVQLTGVDSLSDLLSLLLTKYGRHLRDTWEIPIVQQQSITPVQVSAPVAAEPQYVEEPQPEPEPEPEEPDPVIERLSGLIDTF